MEKATHDGGSTSVPCPNCQHRRSRTADSRHNNLSRVYRRRECLRCKFRFTTYEILESEYRERVSISELRDLLDLADAAIAFSKKRKGKLS